VTNRKNYHHGELRSALIAEGLNQLETAGTGLSLRALAKSVGVSPNAPYRHFSERSELMGALAAEGFHRFANAIIAAGEEPIPLVALKSLGLAYLDFAARNPALYRLMFSPYGYSLDNAECKAEAGRTFGALAGIVARARESGWKPDQAPMALTLSYWSMLHGWAMLAGDKLMPPGVGGANQDDLLAAFIDG
jgi:AcrR family transcriptional regulator